MSEVKFIEHCGEKIFLVDFSNSNDIKSIAVTAEKAIQVVKSTNQLKSIRALIDFSGTSFNKFVIDNMKKMSKSNGPYMKSVAFVGLSFILSPLFKVLLLVSGRSNHKVFGSRQDALEWLIKTKIKYL